MALHIMCCIDCCSFFNLKTMESVTVVAICLKKKSTHIIFAQIFNEPAFKMAHLTLLYFQENTHTEHGEFCVQFCDPPPSHIFQMMVL
jgi:hypothetical protein